MRMKRDDALKLQGRKRAENNFDYVSGDEKKEIAKKEGTNGNRLMRDEFEIKVKPGSAHDKNNHHTCETRDA